MITGKFIRGTEDLSIPKNIRMRVFVDEQGFPAETEMDEYDQRAIHCVLFDDAGQPAATGRLFIDDDGYWRIGRVAVLKEKRGQQLGDLLMRMLLDKALGAKAARFRLSAQKTAQKFYEIYGFTPFGEEYLDYGVPHTEMEATKESIYTAVFAHCRGAEMLEKERKAAQKENQ